MTKITAIVLTLVLGLLAALPLNSASAQATTLKNIPINTSNFNGTLNVTGFTHKGNQILANATLAGALKKADGTTENVTRNLSLPITLTSGTCDILKLAIGAIHLDLLGLVVDVAPINVDITAQSGSGNLLGNLLCAVAKLLDNPGRNVGALVKDLNDILGQL